MYYKLISSAVLFLLMGCGGGWPIEESTTEFGNEPDIVIEKRDDTDAEAFVSDTVTEDQNMGPVTIDCENETPTTGAQCTDGTIYVGQIEDQSLFTTPPLSCTDLTNPECFGETDSAYHTFAQAIRFCEDLSFGGFNDWSVPDIFEQTLLVCRAETASGWRYQYPQFAPNCGLFGGKTSHLKGFIDRYYWSRTETLLGVYMTTFGDGHQKNAFIIGWSPVRCIRKAFQAVDE